MGGGDPATLAFYQAQAPRYTLSFGQAPSRHLDPFLDRLEPGVRVLELGCGGGRDGRLVEATLLENVDRAAKIVNEEAFGPVAVLMKFREWDDALAEVNRSEFGLQAGIFTRDLFKVLEAWDRVDVGGLMVNEIPSYRVDNMPYGGGKTSGLGREGIRFSMEDMTEIRNMVIRRN